MKTNIRTTWTLGLAAAMALFALSSCGNAGMAGSGTASAPTAQPTSAPATATDTTPPTLSPGTSSTAAPAEILIKGFKYQGAETVSPGATVSVSNEDIEAHTITADTGKSFDAIIKVGTDTFTAPTEPGTYPYHCIFHGNMKGTLTVK